MLKTIKIILILLLVIILAGITIKFFWKEYQEKMKGTTFSEGLSKIQSILPEEIFEEGGEYSYKQFQSADKKLAARYPLEWLEITDQKLLQGLFSKEWTEEYQLKTLLFAQGVKGGNFNQLIVSEGIFNLEAEEIIEEMKKNNEVEGWDMEIVKKELEKGIFEAKYQKTNQIDLHSKEKIILVDEGKAYLAAVIVFDKDWQESAKMAAEIIDSVHLVE